MRIEAEGFMLLRCASITVWYGRTEKKRSNPHMNDRKNFFVVSINL